jgi:hypothetical protein
MDSSLQYTVRDQYGNLYGPANAEMLRQWTREGRIVPGMSIRAEGATPWEKVATHPALADLFTGPAIVPAQPMSPYPIAATPISNSQQPNTPVGRIELSYAQAPKRNNPSVIALVLGAVAFITSLPNALFCCCGIFTYPAAIAAIVLGIISLNRFKTDDPASKEKWMPIAAIILGVLAILIPIAGMLLLTVFNGMAPRIR